MIDETKLMRRVAGHHNIRMDGIYDLVLRAHGATVLDIGCNRGMVCYEFANNGAEFVHGVDNYEPGIECARQVFADSRMLKYRFEVADLKGGPDALIRAFGSDYPDKYDIILMLATHHKLARILTPEKDKELLHHLASKTRHYFGWRGRTTDPGEVEAMDHLFKGTGLKRIQTSYISETIGPSAIWARR